MEARNSTKAAHCGPYLKTTVYSLRLRLNIGSTLLTIQLAAAEWRCDTSDWVCHNTVWGREAYLKVYPSAIYRRSGARVIFAERSNHLYTAGSEEERNKQTTRRVPTTCCSSSRGSQSSRFQIQLESYILEFSKRRAFSRYRPQLHSGLTYQYNLSGKSWVGTSIGHTTRCSWQIIPSLLTSNIMLRSHPHDHRHPLAHLHPWSFDTLEQPDETAIGYAGSKSVSAILYK